MYDFIISGQFIRKNIENMERPVNILVIGVIQGKKQFNKFSVIYFRSHVPMPGIADKHLSVVDICQVVGTVIVYKYLPLVHFPPTVGKCAQVKHITNCLLMK